MARSSGPACRAIVALCSLSLASPLEIRAQGVHLGLGATFAGRYLWRGLTRVTGWALQPESFASLQVHGGGYLSAGARWNYELEPPGSGDLSDLAPGRTGLGEADYWSQYARALGGVHASAGFIRYTRRAQIDTLGRTSPPSSSEVYGAVQLASPYFAPKLVAYYDVDRVRGLYLEGGATIALLGNPLGEPFWALYVGGVVGHSLGQEVNRARPSQGANFARRGFTHVGLSLSGDFSPGPLTIHPELHLQFNHDAATRRTGADPRDADRSLSSWFEVSVSWTPRVLKW